MFSLSSLPSFLFNLMYSRHLQCATKKIWDIESVVTGNLLEAESKTEPPLSCLVSPASTSELKKVVFSSRGQSLQGYNSHFFVDCTTDLVFFISCVQRQMQKTLLLLVVEVGFGNWLKHHGNFFPWCLTFFLV